MDAERWPDVLSACRFHQGTGDFSGQIARAWPERIWSPRDMRVGVRVAAAEGVQEFRHSAPSGIGPGLSGVRPRCGRVNFEMPARREARISTRRKTEGHRGPRSRKTMRFARSAFKPRRARPLAEKANGRLRHRRSWFAGSAASPRPACATPAPPRRFHARANDPSKQPGPVARLRGPLWPSAFLRVEKRTRSTAWPR